MPVKPTVLVSTVGSQRDFRYSDTFYDQHRSPRFADGRPWWGEREQAANRGEKDGFLANLMPGDHRDLASVWEAPWYPECRFFEYHFARGKITIRYDKMIAEDTRATAAYYEAANKVAYEKGWPDVEYGALPKWQVRAVIGEPPRSPKIAQAAQAGDPWLLGFVLEPNVELDKLLKLSRGEFARGFAASPDVVLQSDANDVTALIEQAVMRAMADRDAKIAQLERDLKTPVRKPTKAASATTP